ncbi:hypothetical protein BV898_03841 [Hypsibius exemplaris]|uniref:Uncharacterized protein n=1 Tax=Hypsibius exemplaris TaxID=2072580 RepID=A0A1W0X4Q5_HYPEX|nr:hypothetical protein BV898_03841 [Hypsibius exemplaris]
MCLGYTCVDIVQFLFGLRGCLSVFEANNNALNNAIVNAQIRKSLQAQNQAQGPASRFSMPVNNTFRKSTSTGGQRMSEDFQSTSATHRDLATE